MIITIIPIKNYQRFEKLTDRTYFFRYDAQEDTESGMITASEDTIHITPQTTYGDLVTILIRCKYSLDEELALSANMRTSPETHAEEDVQFQQWREYCKDVAREHFDKENEVENV